MFLKEKTSGNCREILLKFVSWYTLLYYNIFYHITLHHITSLHISVRSILLIFLIAEIPVLNYVDVNK